jgi:hypothetical protein
MPQARSQTGSNNPGVTNDAAAGQPQRAAWWRKMLHSTAALAGLLAGTVATEAAPAALDNDNYRPATAAPESWQVFSKQLRAHFERQLAGDDAKARHLQDYMASLQGSGNSGLNFVLRTWVGSDGKVDRVEFDGIDDPNAIDDLRALLVNGNVGAPPPEMLQPLHLRLSLRAKEQDPVRQGP